MQPIEPRHFFIYPLSLVKGICILSVILLHVSPGQLGTEHFNLLADISIFVNCLTRFAVPLFIILSGLYLSLNRRNERAIPFYSRTLKFLIIPYCVYSLVYSLPAFHKNGDLLQIVKNLLTASAHAPLWFGLLILQLYILHPFLSRWFRARKNHKRVIFSAFILQISYLLALSMIFRNADLLSLPAGGAQRLASIFFVSNIGYFLTGYYLLEKAIDMVRLFQDRRTVIVGGLVYLLAAFGLYLYWGVPVDKGTFAAATLRTYLAQNIFVPLLTFAAIIVIFPLVQNRNPSRALLWRILHSFGLYSYGIYYLQGLSGWFVVWIMKRFPIIGIENAVLNLFLFLATAVTALLSVKFLAKLPFGRYIT